MKFSGFCTPSARPVIGSVDVFEPSTASALTTSSISRKTLCFSSTLSKTASITRSHPARSPASAVGVMRASTSSACSWLDLPRATALSKRLAE